VAKQDEVEPTDESGATEPSETADDVTAAADGADADLAAEPGVPEPDDGETSAPSANGDGRDAKVLQPAGVAATSGTAAVERKGAPARTPKATATAKRDQPVKRERTTPLKFVQQSVGELRKVVYPTGQQLVNYFIVVLVFVLFVIGYVSLLDLGFGAAIFRIFS
jgi:preprotein translocase subunit SecE